MLSSSTLKDMFQVKAKHLNAVTKHMDYEYLKSFYKGFGLGQRFNVKQMVMLVVVLSYLFSY